MDKQEELKKQYLQTFTPMEQRGYEIAKNLLGMSFDLEKSIGYNDWKKKQTESQTNK